MRPFIDSHLHLFDKKQGEYAWLKPDNPPFWSDKNTIHRTFTQRDLVAPTDFALQGIVHIEAGFDNARPWREIAYLENTVSLPLRTVAGAALTDPGFDQTLHRLETFKSVSGVRHILDEDAARILANPNTVANMQRLADRDWHFEAQLPVYDNTGTQALLAVLEKTGVRCIINHAGFVPTDNQLRIAWRNNMRALAQHPQVAVKASGWEMHTLSRHWESSAAGSVINELIGLFGTQRVMLASNFPLCLFSCSYSAYWQNIVNCLPQRTIQPLLMDNAVHWYRFNR